MTRPQHGWFLLLSLLAGCAPANRHPQAPTPARSMESLSDEARVRRLDLIDAVRLPDLDRLRQTLAPNAILIRPGGDTIRGIDAIGRELLAFRAALPLETVRGIPTQPAIRCFDGLLERRSEWSLAITGADSIPRFLKGPISIHWTTRGDSLAVAEVKLTSALVTNDEQMGCVSTDAVRYAIRRVELFYTMGVATATSFYGAANSRLLAAGYTESNSPNQLNFPDGGPPRSAQMIGMSARLINHAWLTVAAPYKPERSDLGRCDVQTFNYVRMARERQPWFFSLDARAHGFSLGAGPVFAADHYRYQEANFVPRPPDENYFGRCFAEVVVEPSDSSTTTSVRHSTGLGSTLSYMVSAGPHAAFMARAQLVRFPAAPGRTTSSGVNLSFRDLTTTLGLGVVFTY